MGKPEDIPQDVRVQAEAICAKINEGIWTADDGPSISWGQSRAIVARAILAERERCAKVAHTAAYEAIHGAVVCHGEMTSAEIDDSASDVECAVLSGGSA